jgi:hypothetical protein
VKACILYLKKIFCTIKTHSRKKQLTCEYRTHFPQIIFYTSRDSRFGSITITPVDGLMGPLLFFLPILIELDQTASGLNENWMN